MKSSYKPISELVERIDIRNSDGDAAILMGLSIDKCFIHSVANTVGTDLTKYKVICKNQFAVSLMQVSRDSKIPVACFREYDRAIMSPAYSIFQVADESVVLPDYLDMWFKRPEFDREAAFVAVGGVRGSMPWEEFARIKVHVPTLERQRKIVDAYKAVNERIHIKQQLNDNLEAQTQALFDELFLRDGMPDCTLSEIANVNPTRTLSKGCIAKCYDMSCLPTRGCVPEGGEMKAYNGGARFQNGDTLIARITPCLENGKAAYINILNDKEVAFGSTEYIVFSPVDTMPSSFYYFLIRSKKFRTFALQYMNGSSGRQRVSGDELAAFPLTKPSQEALSRFDMVAKPVLEQFKVASLEINRLNALQQLIIASISSR